MKLPGIALALALALVSISGHVRADNKDVKSAVVAFDRAEQLMKDGQLAEACAHYAESYRLDPQLGALLHVGDCNERIGKLATAWKAFERGRELALEKGDERAAVARARAQALLPRLSYVRIVPPKNPGVAIEVRLDRTLLDAQAMADKIPSDAGPHVVAVTLPGEKTREISIALEGEGTVHVIDIGAFQHEVGAAPGAAPQKEAVPKDAAAESGSHGTFQRIAGFSAIGLGAVGFGVSGYFFARQASKSSDADALQKEFDAKCPAGGTSAQCSEGSMYVNDTNSELARLGSEEKSARTGGIIAAAAGGAFIITGVVLLLTIPAAHSDNALTVLPELTPQMGMVTLRGAF